MEINVEIALLYSVTQKWWKRYKSICSSMFVSELPPN